MMSTATALSLLLAAQPPATLAPALIDQQPAPDPATPSSDAGPQPLPAQPVTVEPDAAAILIKGITFEGVEAPAPVAAAARAFLGQPASRATLTALAKAVANAYAKANIALYTVAIPHQELSDGHVRLLLAEGFVEDIVYPKGASPLIRAYADRLRAEKPLSRRALERYLSLMRDIPGAKLDIALLRGRRPGGVVLSITPERKKVDFSAGLDNRRQNGLGSGQFRASAQGNSLLRDGDRTDLIFLSAIDFKRYRYLGFSHQTPLGSDGLMLGLSASTLRTHLKNFPVTGSAQTLGMTLSYPLIRGYKRNLTLSAGIDGLNSDAALLGAVLSSDHIRTARAAISYGMVGQKSVLTASATVARGLEIFGARGTPGFTDPLFTKWTVRTGYDRALGKQWVGRLRLKGQYSGDRLSGSERFAIGGPEFGRAFDTALLSGDSGMAGSFELALKPNLPDRLKGTELYGFIDGAKIHVKERLVVAAATYSLASVGGGLRLAYNPHASLGLEGAKVIDRPYPGAGDEWRFNISWRVKMRR